MSYQTNKGANEAQWKQMAEAICGPGVQAMSLLCTFAIIDAAGRADGVALMVDAVMSHDPALIVEVSEKAVKEHVDAVARGNTVADLLRASRRA